MSAADPVGDVAGESLMALRRALAHFRTSNSMGEITLDAAIPHEEALPFMRALMRVEAELLRHEADRSTAPDARCRTADERRADALVALVLRIEEAGDA